METDRVLCLESVRYVYDLGTPFATEALCDIDLSIYRGETLVLMGKPGSGKSTLLQLMNGLLRPTKGRVLLDGRDMWQKKKLIPNAREKVGLVFQYPEHQLFEITVGKDISFGPRMMGLAEDEIEERVERSLAFVGLDQALAERSPRSLSMGQKRLAALAGVMAMEPEVLVLDEPTAGLDPSARREILERLRGYKHKNAGTLVLATHRFEDVAAVAERIVVLDAGRIAKSGTVAEILDVDQENKNELTELGLKQPEITRLMQHLAARGIPLATDIITPEDAAKQILSLYAQNRG